MAARFPNINDPFDNFDERIERMMEIVTGMTREEREMKDDSHRNLSGYFGKLRITGREVLKEHKSTTAPDTIWHITENSKHKLKDAKESAIKMVKEREQSMLDAVGRICSAQLRVIEDAYYRESKRLSQLSALAYKAQPHFDKILRTYIHKNELLELKTTKELQRELKELETFDHDLRSFKNTNITSATLGQFETPDENHTNESLVQLFGKFEKRTYDSENALCGDQCPMPQVHGRAGPMLANGSKETTSVVQRFNLKTYNDANDCHPLSFALNSACNVLYPDPDNCLVKVFTKEGQLLQEIRHKEFVTPSYIAVDSDGNFAVSDPGARSVFEMSSDGTLIRTHNTLLSEPGGLNYLPDNRLLVTDIEDHSVILLSNQAPKKLIFKQVQNISVNNAGVIAFSDKIYQEVHQMDSVDKRLSVSFNQRNTPPEDQFIEPLGLCFDRYGRIVLADKASSSIKSVDFESGELKTIINKGHDLIQPTCVCALPHDLLMVSEAAGTIKVFGGRQNWDIVLNSGDEAPPAYEEVFDTDWKQVQPTPSFYTGPSAPDTDGYPVLFHGEPSAPESEVELPSYQEHPSAPQEEKEDDPPSYYELEFGNSDLP